MAIEQARRAIEQAVEPGVIPSYAHPANFPQCMVHGHRRGLPITMRLHIPDLAFNGSVEIATGLVACRACGTVYALTSP
jgi:hypothetical protein